MRIRELLSYSIFLPQEEREDTGSSRCEIKDSFLSVARMCIFPARSHLCCALRHTFMTFSDVVRLREFREGRALAVAFHDEPCLDSMSSASRSSRLVAYLFRGRTSMVRSIYMRECVSGSKRSSRVALASASLLQYSCFRELLRMCLE